MASRAADSLSGVVSPSARSVSATAATAANVANGISANIGPRKHTAAAATTMTDGATADPTAGYRAADDDALAAVAAVAAAAAATVTVNASATTAATTRADQHFGDRKAKLRSAAESSLHQVLVGRAMAAITPHPSVPSTTPPSHHAGPLCHPRPNRPATAPTLPPCQDPKGGHGSRTQSTPQLQHHQETDGA